MKQSNAVVQLVKPSVTGTKEHNKNKDLTSYDGLTSVLNFPFTMHSDVHCPATTIANAFAVDTLAIQVAINIVVTSVTRKSYPSRPNNAYPNLPVCSTDI